MSRDITIACDTRFLPVVRKFIGSVLYEMEFSDTESQKLILAVDEICANLIIHANESNPDKFLKICIKRGLKQLVFEISDRGKKFDITKYREPKMEEIVATRRKGGLGIILVRRIMDDIEFTTEKNHNICRLIKKL